MPDIKEAPTCPHCGKKMSKWAGTQLQYGGCTTWTGDFLYVCFNDECPYFVKGWDWMWNNYHRHVSYRHMLDPDTGKTNPFPVKSKDALRKGIIEE
jgi:hypothetical protein